ncbi:hypothetical protein Tco_0907595 [Tanacetum coccineum]|uniref:Retrovirus-related Pol polyprotein from transposon TNT 1-94-like beta-barrel domain-containing protein n=1 Tax=Tanacetum coccineum TaxID=301880 RepID=A0ABQ5CK12_9ASTR
MGCYEAQIPGQYKSKNAQLQRLRRDFEMLEMKAGETVIDFLGRVMVIANDMRNAGEDMSDVKIVEKLYSNRGRGRGRGRSQSENMPQFDKSQIECYKCHQLGNFQYECSNEARAVNYAEFEDNEEILLKATVDVEGYEKETERLMAAVSKDKHDKVSFWFLDSACSNYMTGIKEWFIRLDETYQHKVRLGNGHRLEVKGKGDVRLTVNGITQVITNVYYAPLLTSNLISVGQLQEKSLTFVIQGGVCMVFHPQKGLIITSNMTKNKMFPINVSLQL